jgi:hypothetical protein
VRRRLARTIRWTVTRTIRRTVTRSARRTVTRAAESVGLAWQTVGRLTPAALGVRVAVFGSGATALVLASPGSVGDIRASGSSGLVAGALGLVALAAAVRPGGRAPEAAMAVVVGCWLLRTWGSGHEAALWRVFAIAGLLYLLHTTAALAAVVPLDTVVQPGALRRGLVRVAGVLALSAALTTVVVAALMVRAGDREAGAAYVGVGAVIAVVVLLAAASHRARVPRPGPDARDSHVPGPDVRAPDVRCSDVTPRPGPADVSARTVGDGEETCPAGPGRGDRMVHDRGDQSDHRR